MRNSIRGSQLPNPKTHSPSCLPATLDRWYSDRAAVRPTRRFPWTFKIGATLAILTTFPLSSTLAEQQFRTAVAQPSRVAPSASLSSGVTVGIWSLSNPTALRAVPANAAARMRLCNSCRWIHSPSPVNVRAAGGEVRLVTADGLSSASNRAEFSGAWSFELPGGASAHSASRATISPSQGHLQVALSLSMEEYVAAVLAAEARGVTSPESLKAMAVSIRTYAMRFRDRHPAQPYQFCDSTHCQAMRLSRPASRYLAAAEATAGEILTYRGKPATTYYHRDCGGTTEAAGIAWRDVDVPYLRQQADPYCTRLAHKGWSAEISQSDLARALIRSGIAPPLGWHGIEVVTRTPSGRARKLRLVGSNNLLIAAQALRLAVARALGGNKIRSDLFEVHAQGTGYVFSGVGSGHGIGLCQNGAAEMGVEGKRYNDILAFYYPGTTLRAGSRSQAVASGN